MPAAARTVGRPARGLGGSDARLGWLLVAPLAIVMLALVFVPLGMTLIDSLYRVDPMRAAQPFIGLRHYVDLAADTNVRTSALNTLALVAICVVLETVGGIAAALLLQRIEKGRMWLLAALIVPWALPPVVNALVWLWIYHPSVGLLNNLLLSAGLISHKVVWFNDRATALFLVAVVHVWRMLPLTAIIVLAALQAIPTDLYEAARLDGAGPVRSFLTITLPLIAGGLGIAMTQSTVFAFNLFDEAWILAGASLDTRTVLIQVYMSAFQQLHFSYGMALSVLLMLASLAVSIFYVLGVYRETRID
ncbi:carbohydrate ABC transporter membrane protein 1, CUT1 family [Arboricoccus pini]|uniref:Carbohydrate ABC transporter membrane protein 1, CUT1 family n=1 Tax=Arboricoccus pini TaxID=1963835 RepID=A0A212RMZ1_9PROT|nr:sugar ABC transporter permease [Arboricoccus pini]SNB73934.1 carbohydrate ABC transporter membrane protein 1, CUT1 family [Arboricoccus pini]